jgi:hypothetical protein
LSIKAIAAAYRVKAGSPTNKAVLLALADHADDGGQCFPSVPLLVEKTELKERAVRAALADLEKLGLISRKPQYHGSTKYRRANLVTLRLDMVQDVHDDGAPDAPYGAPGAPTMVQDVQEHGAGDAPQENRHITIKEESPKNRARARDAIAGFEAEFESEFWPIWPTKAKVDQKNAKKSFVKARQAGTPIDTIILGVKSYVSTKPDWQQWKGPAAWINGERWGDFESAASDQTRATASKFPDWFGANFVVAVGSDERKEWHEFMKKNWEGFRGLPVSDHRVDKDGKLDENGVLRRGSVVGSPRPPSGDVKPYKLAA